MAVLWLTMQVDNAAVIIYGVSLAYKESGMKSHLFVCLSACLPLGFVVACLFSFLRTRSLPVVRNAMRLMGAHRVLI